jgi:hypothetical protein
MGLPSLPAMPLLKLPSLYLQKWTYKMVVLSTIMIFHTILLLIKNSLHRTKTGSIPWPMPMEFSGLNMFSSILKQVLDITVKQFFKD